MSEWIKCEDQLPIAWSEKDGKVDVIVGMPGAYSGVAVFFKRGKTRGWRKVHHIFTHWQPLPPPPEQTA